MNTETGPGGESWQTATRRIFTNPRELFLTRWHWKSAILSALVRGLIFFAVNLSSGLAAACSAFTIEYLYRSAASGFYGSLTQNFRRVTPVYAGNLIVSLILPLLQHSLELLVHWSNGTPQLLRSMTASIMFTVVSTLFNLHAMRHGALLVGHGSRPLRHDLIRIPGLLASFIVWLPVDLFHRCRCLVSRLRPGVSVKEDRCATKPCI